jgi:uncharacterized membrane protein YphA (DoxX/SURF4 family)
MAVLVGIVGSIAAGGVLLAAGTWHVRHQAALRAALYDHRLWPRNATRVLAPVVAGVELGTGLMMACGLALRLEGALALASSVAAALFVTYAAYSLWLWRARPTASCGCDSSGDPATAATVVRAGILAVTALGAAAAAGSTGDPLDAYQLATAILAGAGWGAIVWSLPGALVVPDPRSRAGQAVS